MSIFVDDCTQFVHNIFRLVIVFFLFFFSKQTNSILIDIRYLLQQRSYHKLLVEHRINKAKCHDRNEILQIKDKAEKCVLIIDFSTHNPKNQELF